jgi:DNA topoisomerase IB
MPRLVRARPLEDPGFTRTRAGQGFSYADARGKTPPEADLERIHSLVLPPAWTDVWIAREPRAHIQAVGTDDAGRRQYVYHPDWTAGRDKGKYARALDLAAALPRARGRVTTALRRDELSRERVLAAAFRLLDEAAPRVGTAKYFTTNGSRGLTTLQRRDATVEASTITLSFPAKSGKRALITVDDEDLAITIAELSEGRPRSPLLASPFVRR